MVAAARDPRGRGETARAPSHSPACGGAARREVPADLQHRMGWVITTLQNAFHHLMRATPLAEEALPATVAPCVGQQPDTNAAICGALLGALQGRDAVPAAMAQRRADLPSAAGAGHPPPSPPARRNTGRMTRSIWPRRFCRGGCRTQSGGSPIAGGSTFPGLRMPLRVERRLFNCSHRRQFARAAAVAQPVALQRPDAVFGRDRTAEVPHKPIGDPVHLVRLRLAATIRPASSDVQVAVGDVPEETRHARRGSAPAALPGRPARTRRAARRQGSARRD